MHTFWHHDSGLLLVNCFFNIIVQPSCPLSFSSQTIAHSLLPPPQRLLKATILSEYFILSSSFLILLFVPLALDCLYIACVSAASAQPIAAQCGPNSHRRSAQTHTHTHTCEYAPQMCWLAPGQIEAAPPRGALWRCL